jgi:Tfp pilus assembly protein PilF
MREGGGFYNELGTASNAASDYTGPICAPEFQDRAIPAFARHIQRLNWTNLRLKYVCASDDRAQLFLNCFSQEKFEARFIPDHFNPDGINLCICPYVRLPDDWETYLSGNVGTNTRQKIRRFLRKVDNSEEFRITHADASTIGRDLDILFRFWEMKWGPSKGKSSRDIQDNIRALLMHCFENGTLFLPVLWKGEAPLGALAILVDSVKRSLLFRIAGRDETFDDLPPGFVLHAYSIRYAIHNGFTVYDFLRGNEPYKYAFGSDERRIRHIDVRTKDGENLGKRLDRRSLPVVLRRTAQLHLDGRLAEAELGYRQALEIKPRSPDALYGLGQLMAQKGDYDAAEALFKALVDVAPESYKAWLRLGDILEAQRRFPEAVDAYCKAIRRRPEAPAAHDARGHAPPRPGQSDEATAALETAAGLSPAT